MPKNSSFRILWSFSRVIAHSFWVSAGFACLERTLTCLRDMTRNSPFSRFMAVFMSYCPQFWGYRAIYNDFKTRYMFESYAEKLVFFVFMAIFMSYCPRFLVPIGFARHVRPVTFLRDMTRNLPFSRFMAVFMSYCPQFRGSRAITVTFRPDTCWKDMTRNL